MGVFIYLTQDNLKMGSRDEAFTLTGLEIGLIQPRFSSMLASIVVGEWPWPTQQTWAVLPQTMAQLTSGCG